MKWMLIVPAFGSHPIETGLIYNSLPTKQRGFEPGQRRALRQAGVGPLGIAMPSHRRQRGGAFVRGGIGPGVGPFAQAGLDEAGLCPRLRAGRLLVRRVQGRVRLCLAPAAATASRNASLR